MNLYSIKFKYMDNGEEVDDQWFVALSDWKSVEKFMDVNINSFESCGYKFLEYSFREINETDNDYKISLHKN